jgi:hypothetical protein
MFDKNKLEEIDSKKKEWKENTLKKTIQRFPERKKAFLTTYDENIDVVYTPKDIEKMNYLEDIGFPGEYPFTRGVQPTMYRGKLWTMRQYAGFGIIGGIEVEHIVDKIRDNSTIVTQVGGPGGKLALYLNDFFHLKPIILDFLSIDEYFDLILKTFQMKKIQVVWLDKPLGNKRKIRILNEDKEYIDLRETKLKIEAEFLIQFFT